jgi:hypothetical protein
MLLKKAVITSLACAMILGSGTAAMAQGNGNKNDKKNVEIHLTFDDLKNAEWAIRYIASLASKRVFEGYEDGTFKPNNTVSRIEAIAAAVRLMGLRSQAESAEEMNTRLNFKDADKIPSWAVGYVAVALENDLFNEGDDKVDPQRNGDRLWATTLLVKALKLDAEAKAKMNTKLPFKDANQIPAGSVGYIAVAIEKGLVDGFEDNTFRPNQPVTRAQLAALLDRTGNHLPDSGNETFTGSISGVVHNQYVRISRAGGAADYVLHPDVFIYRGGSKVNPTALQVGDAVKVSIYNNQIVFIEVTSSVQPILTNGTVSAVNNNTLTVTKSGVTSSLVFHSDIVVYRGGVRVNPYELKVGDEVNLRISDNKIIYVEVTKTVQPVLTTGSISAVNNQTLTITKSGVTASLTLHSDVVIYRNGVKVPVSELKIGDEVNVRTADNKVIYIEVTKSVVPITSNGTVSAAVSNNVLKIKKSGAVIDYTLHADVIIYRNGVKVNASELKVGDEVNIRTSDNKVIFIEVTQTAQAITNSGTLQALVSNNMLKLVKSGVTYDLTLHADVIVYRNGVKVNPAELKIGDEVNIRTSENKVIYIEVTKVVQPITNTGTVNAKVSKQILQLKHSEVITDFSLHNDVIVYRGGVKVRASDLKVGDQVDIRTSNSKVIYIEVTKMVETEQPFDVTGKLVGTTLNVQGELATISIVQTIHDKEQTVVYNVSANVKLSGNLSLFKEGQPVQLIGKNRIAESIVVK